MTTNKASKHQKDPKKNDLPCVQDMVIADLEARKKVGIERYGTILQPHNGRDTLMDLYQELLDACNYVRQVIYERDNPQPKGRCEHCGEVDKSYEFGGTSWCENCLELVKLEAGYGHGV